jgi:group I intron endonuclease
MVIYETINKINGKRYIGKDKHNDPNYLGSGAILNKAIKKYGRENFIKTILEHCDSEDHMAERERHWIQITNAQTSDVYYNIGAGGNGGDNITHHPNRDKFIKKMTVINNDPKYIRTKKGHSEQTKQNQSKAAQGRYTLEWFQTKYGNDEGERRYTERNHRLSTRYLNNKTEQWLSELTAETLLVLLQQKTQEQIKHEYNITHKRLYKKYQEFWGCNTYSEVKKRLL